MYRMKGIKSTKKKKTRKKRSTKWQKRGCSHYIHSSQVRYHTEGLPRAGLCAGFRTRPAKKLARAWFCDFSPPDVARVPPRLTSLSCGESRLLAGNSCIHQQTSTLTLILCREWPTSTWIPSLLNWTGPMISLTLPLLSKGDIST